MDSFLSISIIDKPFHQPVSEKDIKEHQELPFRMVDLGGVGIEADKSDWGRDYSHNTKRFQKVFLTQWPYVDENELLKVETQYKEYMDKMAQYGFNAIEFQAFLELIDFDMVGNGYEVYKENSIYRQRHQALREVYGEFFRYAHEKGFKVIISTDMVALIYCSPLRTEYS